MQTNEREMRTTVNKAQPDSIDNEQIKMAEGVVVIIKIVEEEGIFEIHAVHMRANTTGLNVGIMKVVPTIGQTDS